MKKISTSTLQFIPASHENPQNPGVVKKILFTQDDLSPGVVKMINWAKLGKDMKFTPHYHEDMEEIFIILSGRAKIYVNREEEIVKRGDAIIVSSRKIHSMENVGSTDVEYIVIGISTLQSGKTIIVKEDE